MGMRPNEKNEAFLTSKGCKPVILYKKFVGLLGGSYEIKCQCDFKTLGVDRLGVIQLSKSRTSDSTHTGLTLSAILFIIVVLVAIVFTLLFAYIIRIKK
jgi:hypothetical protein